MEASLKYPEEGPRVGFGGGGEGLEVQRLLAGGPDVVNPGDKVLAQGEKTLVQCRHCVSRLEHQQVKLRDLGRGPVAKTDRSYAQLPTQEVAVGADDDRGP